MDEDELAEKYPCKFLDSELTILHNLIIVCYARGTFKLEEMENLSILWDRMQDFSGEMTRKELNVLNNILVISHQRQSFKLGEFRNVGKLWEKIQKILEIKNECDIKSDLKIEAKLDVKGGGEKRLPGSFVMRPLQDKDGINNHALNDSFGKINLKINKDE